MPCAISSVAATAAPAAPAATASTDDDRIANNLKFYCIQHETTIIYRRFSQRVHHTLTHAHKTEDIILKIVK